MRASSESDSKMTLEIVSLKDVWVHYDNVLALENINLSINKSDFLGIIGPNGGGKTTLLKVIVGLVEPSRGEVRVFGDTPERSRRQVGYVPQQVQLDRSFPASVQDVVLMGRLGHARPFRQFTGEDKKIVWDCLEKVEMLNLRHRQIGRLSEGQRQRVYIARALATEPKMLLLDEPTASIDEPTQKEFFELLQDLKQNMSVILVTHDIGVISTYVDKIACLNRRLFYHGSKEITPEMLQELYQCPVEILAHGVPHRVLKEH